jgi:hypothetical protein
MSSPGIHCISEIPPVWTAELRLLALVICSPSDPKHRGNGLLRPPVPAARALSWWKSGYFDSECDALPKTGMTEMMQACPSRRSAADTRSLVLIGGRVSHDWVAHPRPGKGARASGAERVHGLRPRLASPVSCPRLRREKGERASPHHVNALRAPQAYTKSGAARSRNPAQPAPATGAHEIGRSPSTPRRSRPRRRRPRPRQPVHDPPAAGEPVHPPITLAP